MKQTIAIFGMLVLLAASGSPVFAGKMNYEETPVVNGGSIHGVVSFEGPVPNPVMEDLGKGKNAEFCATHPETLEGGIRPRHKVVVNDGRLRDTVIFIENIERGKPWPKGPSVFEFRQCDIFPKVTVVRKSTKKVKEGMVTILNQDENILHNPHGYSVVGASRKTLFNKPLPTKGSVADVTRSLKRLKAKKDKHFFLQCDQHNYMEADARVVWNPYYALSGPDGTFTIKDIPAGRYRVIAWHPYAGEISREITVDSGADTKADFSLSSE